MSYSGKYTLRMSERPAIGWLAIGKNLNKYTCCDRLGEVYKVCAFWLPEVLDHPYSYRPYAGGFKQLHYREAVFRASKSAEDNMISEPTRILAFCDMMDMVRMYFDHGSPLTHGMIDSGL